MKSLLRFLHSALLISLFCATLQAQQISLQALVTPSTVITKDGHTVKFALHGFIEFSSLSELFSYIDSQVHRWPGNPSVDDAKRQQLVRELLRRGSRAVSFP
jgi:hypothetical protein